MPSRPRGYTLVEAAIALAVLLLLAMLLLPVFSDARAKARQAGCAMNQRQLMTATLAYASDYDQRLPPPSRPSGRYASEVYTWRWMLTPYLYGDGILLCPSDQVPTDDAWRRPTGGRLGVSGESSYGVNALHSAPDPPTEPWRDGVALDAAAARRGDVVLLFQAQTIVYAETAGKPWVRAPSIRGHFAPGSLAAEGLVLDRHRHGANYAFADGHVKWLRPGGVQCNSGGGADGCPWSVE